MPNKVTTGLVRFSYLHVFEPYSVEGSDPKYSVSIIIPKRDTETLQAIRKQIKAALKEGESTKFGGKIPKSWKDPLRDGDDEREDREEYANSYFVNCSSKRKPGLVDLELNPIIDRDELYSGCYGRASINFYAFNTNGNKGVAAGLNGLQKVRDGEPLGGAVFVAEEDFGDDFSDSLLD